MEKRIVRGLALGAAWTMPAVAVALGLAGLQACGDSSPRLVPVGADDGGVGPGNAGDGSTDGSLFVTRPADAGVRPSDAGCDPSTDPQTDACVLTEANGVFVVPGSAGDGGAGDAGDTGARDGSRAAPYTSLGEALAHVQGKARVYVCNGDYSEAVSLQSPVSLFGGLTCAGGAWKWVGGVARVTAPAAASGTSAIALSIASPTGGVTIEDMAFASSDATGQAGDGSGASSIAALVSATSVRFVRSVLTARDGAGGAGGVTGVRISDGGIDPTNYDPPDAVAPRNDAGGIAPASNVCAYVDDAGVQDRSSGGVGGDPAGVPDGGDGTSVPPPVFIPGVTPAGHDGMGGVGHIGEDGPPRPAGSAATSPGVLSPGGWLPTSGAAGLPGQPGQGGGGTTALLDLGVAGRGGSSGGCGGAGGSGGGGGGGSVALAVLAGTVTLEGCTLTTGHGGDGGPGGAGQDGQHGGGAVGARFGAPGGNGAGGSGGGGGSAGISVGILYSAGSVLSYDPADTVIIPGVAGVPGPGGPGGLQINAGGNAGSAGYLDPHASSATLSTTAVP
jgi:hypothetical protein